MNTLLAQQLATEADHAAVPTFHLVRLEFADEIRVDFDDRVVVVVSFQYEFRRHLGFRRRIHVINVDLIVLGVSGNTFKTF